MALFIGTTGERDDIGILSSFHARHFFTQAAVDERVARIIGLSQCNLSTCMRDHTTHNVLNMSANSYKGMPASVATTLVYRPTANLSAGFTAPPGPGWQLWTQCFSGVDDTHMTQYSAYPYIMSGEPQYCDLLLEMANVSNSMWPQADRNFTIGATNYKGIGPAGKDSYRPGAWAWRDILWAAILAPDINPDGSASTAYLRDLAALQSTYMVAWNNNSQSAWWTASGFWVPQGNRNGRSSWQMAYLSFSANLAANAFEDANALTIATHFSKWPPYIRTLTGNAFMLGTYYEMSSSSANAHGAPAIMSDTLWGSIGSSLGGLRWVTAGNLFTISGPNFTPANGDKYVFWSSTDKPSGFNSVTAYYAINVSGNTFQLSTSRGGPAVTVGANGSQADVNKLYYLPATPPSTSFVGGGVGASGYGADQLAMVNWMIASGITTTGLTAVRIDLATRQAAAVLTTDPKNALSNTF